MAMTGRKPLGCLGVGWPKDAPFQISIFDCTASVVRYVEKSKNIIDDTQ